MFKPQSPESALPEELLRARQRRTVEDKAGGGYILAVRPES